MKKVILSAVALGTVLTANAQLLNYGFDTSDVLPGETKIVDENWNKDETAWQSTFFEFPKAEVGVDGTSALYAVADSVGRGTWDRVIAFTNLGIQENKAYRISMDLKGTGNLNVALLKGKFNYDKALVAANGAESYAEQTKNFAGTEDYKKISYLVWSPSKEIMVAQKAALEPDSIWNLDFLRLSFNGAGTYYVDNVKVEEAAIQGVRANETTLAVDFGFTTNAAELAKAAGGTKLLNKEDVKVIVDEAEAEVISVELKEDGNMYIFITNDFTIADAEQVATVTFTNSCDEFVYTGSQCPAYGQKVTNFENEPVVLDGSVFAVSYYYEEAELMTSNPEDSSFGLDENLNEFSFTFNRAVMKFSENNGAPKATLSGKSNDGKTSVNEELELTTTADLTETLTFKRKTAGTLPKGNYQISLDYVCNQMDVANSNPFVIAFETGKVKVAKTTYTEIATKYVPDTCANNVPEGWEIMTESMLRTHSAEGYGSNGRVMNRNIGAGAYFRAGEGQEAYVLTDAVELPAGEIVFRAYVASWKSVSHNITVAILNADSSVVAEATEATTALNAEGADAATWEYQAIDVKFTATAGNYRIKFIEKTLDGNGLFVKGGKFLKTEVSEGDSFTPEVIAAGSFAGISNDWSPAHGTGWKIYRGDGRMRTPGVSCGWGGSCWTGGGGPRCKSAGNKGLGGTAIYLAGGCYATYGQFAVQTAQDANGVAAVLDSLGNEVPEKLFEASKAKYQVTYYIIGWKTTTSNVKFEIFNYADGITGTPIYTRTDAVPTEGHSNQGGDSKTDAKKVQFFWTAPASGNYIIKVTSGGDGEGESLFGNMSIETTASLAIQYAQMMDQNLQPAKEELALAMEKEEYRGTTRDALAQIIKDNEEPRFNTVAQYEAEFTKINNLIKKSQTRRSNIDSYPTSLQAIKDGLDAATGKYENLKEFPIVEKAYNDYKDVDYIALDDDALNEAVKVMGNNGTLLKNMVNTCVPLLTKQLVDLAAAIAALDNDSLAEECTLAAAEALDDNQTLVNELKVVYAAKLYTKIAAGENLFETLDITTDSVEGIEVLDTLVVPATIDANFLIQNPNFYCVGPAVVNAGNVTITTDQIPGWTFDVTKGSLACTYGTASWCGEYPTDVKPVLDCAARSGWGTTEFTVEQLISNLPVANYNISLTIGEDGSVHKSFAYCGNDTAKYETESYSRDESTPRSFTGVTPAIDEETKLASVKLGAYMYVEGGFINVDKATLTMTGKAEGFDYAAAAQKLNKEAELNIANVEIEGMPVAVSYFNLAGQQVAAPQGVNIKIERYANGCTVVKKVIVK